MITVEARKDRWDKGIILLELEKKNTGRGGGAQRCCWRRWRMDVLEPALEEMHKTEGGGGVKE